MHNTQKTAQIIIEKAQEQMLVSFSGVWNIVHPLPQIEPLLQRMQEPQVKTVFLQVRDLEAWDSSLLAMVVRLTNHAKLHNVQLDVSALPDGLQKLLSMSFKEHVNEQVIHEEIPAGFLGKISTSFQTIPLAIGNFLEFLGEICI